MRDDLALSRRDFMQRTAYAAGLAGVAGLPLEAILAEGAEAAQVHPPGGPHLHALRPLLLLAAGLDLAQPDPPQIATQACSLGGGDVLDSQLAHANDLAGLDALAERFGVPVYEGRTHQIFREPDSLRRGLRASRRRDHYRG